MMTVDTKTDTKTDMGTDTDTARTMRAVVNRAGGPIDGPESLMDARVPVPRGPNGHDLLVLSGPEALPQEIYNAFAQYLRGVVLA